MAEDEHSRFSSNEVVVPFLFVPHGQEPSPTWLADHPGAIRLSATLVRHKSGSGTAQSSEARPK